MRPFMSILLAIAAPAAVKAWSIAFYTGDNCNEDPTYNNAIYYTAYGTDEMQCHQAGAPGQGCVWYTPGWPERNSAECTVPMNPPPKSFMFGNDAMCIVGWDAECQEPSYAPSWPVPQGGQCFSVADLEGGVGWVGTILTFECYDVPPQPTSSPGPGRPS